MSVRRPRRVEIRVVELAESAVGLEAFVWIENPARAEVLWNRSENVQAVKERFDEAGIEMPYPDRQLTGRVCTWDAASPR